MIGLQDDWSFSTAGLSWPRQSENDLKYVSGSVSQWPNDIVNRNNFCKLDIDSEKLSIAFFYDTGNQVSSEGVLQVKSIPLV